MKAWIYQIKSQVAKHGTGKASWYVAYYDPTGKQRCESCGPGFIGKKAAQKLRDKRQSELSTGTYKQQIKETWEAFRKEYSDKVLEVKGIRHRDEANRTLDHFERLIKPVKMVGIDSLTVADFIVKRRKEKGLQKDEDGNRGLVSNATINKDLRYLRAAFRKAKSWKYLAEVPEIEFLDEIERIITYVSPEHFATIYQGCEQAEWPEDQHYPASDWWRALLMTAYMTGWRIGALMALRWEHVDLDEGTALSLGEDNKGKRDQKIALHPMVIEHLRKIPTFSPMVFPWNHGTRMIFAAFEAIQKNAGIKLKGNRDHYGFHDLRRAFATMNADTLTPDALQALMQHKDYQTTQRYINMAAKLKPAVQTLFVPNVAKRMS